MKVNTLEEADPLIEFETNAFGAAIWRLAGKITWICIVRWIGILWHLHGRGTGERHGVTAHNPDEAVQVSEDRVKLAERPSGHISRCGLRHGRQPPCTFKRP